MSDTINEQVSAFVDGELPDAERELLQRRLASDEELQGTWQRYHLIRDAMREDLPEFIARKPDTTYMQDDELSLDSTAASATILQRLAKPAAGFAIAASVAMLAVVGVLYNGDQLSSPPPVQIAENKPAQLPDNFIIVPRNGWESAKPAVVSYLNGYLVDHSNYSGFGTSQSIIPYSRVAGYDQPLADKALKENATRESSDR